VRVERCQAGNRRAVVSLDAVGVTPEVVRSSMGVGGGEFRRLPPMKESVKQRHVDLSHVISDGMVTYPGLPSPVIETHLSREAAEEVYGPGVTFHIGLVTMCTNTGTYLDVPYHRFADGHDLADLDLVRVASVPAVCLDRRGTITIDLDSSELVDLEGHAVLVRTDHSSKFGTAAYADGHPHLAVGAAEALVAAGVACVGIDSLNIDSTDDSRRPVHTTLLRAGIPIIEHLTNLGAVPSSGFSFTAVPPKIEHAGTFTVRAYATIRAQDAPEVS
jgi:kynurenine formamidase